MGIGGWPVSHYIVLYMDVDPLTSYTIVLLQRAGRPRGVCNVCVQRYLWLLVCILMPVYYACMPATTSLKINARV